MKNTNICKFITTPPSDILVMKNFILETQKEDEPKERKLGTHVAYLVLCGSVKFVFATEEVVCASGALIFAFSGEGVKIDPDDGAEYMYISFDGGRASELFRRFGISGQNRVFPSSEGLIPIWRDSLFKASENALDIAAESSLLFAFSHLASENLIKDDVLRRALLIMEHEFSNPELDLSAVADAVGYNAKYFSHLFKKQMNVSFSEYLRNLRVKHAVFLFEHGIESVKNVAYLSGFKDPLYFSGVFKAVLGVTPKEYKNQINAR